VPDNGPNFAIPVGFRAQEMELNMKTMKKLIVYDVYDGLVAACFRPKARRHRESTQPRPRITLARPQWYAGRWSTPKTSRYGIAGRGKPVTFDLDQPERNPVFYFVTFGAQPGGPEEALAAYKDKRVCVTGKIRTQAGVPFIMADDRSLIKLQAENK